MVTRFFRIPASWAAAVLCVLAWLAYASSFSVPLILDDWVTIKENPQIRQIWPIWKALSPPEQTGVGGRPIANLSFVLNFAITGDSLAGYHAGNLLVHLLAALSLFGILRRTLNRQSRKPANDFVALGSAVLWMLHPLQTQSVTYLSQRTESLMGLFYLGTLYFFIRYADTRVRRDAVLSVVCCALGMACKEGMVTAPLAVLAYDYVFISRGLRGSWRIHRALYCCLGITWLLLPFLMTGLHGRGVGFDVGTSWWAYVLIECEAIWRYISLTLWPHRLVFDYGTEFEDAYAKQILLGLLLVATAMATVIALRRKSAVGFAGAWFFLTLAPTSSIVPIPLQPISENRAYLATAAVLIAILLVVSRAGGRALTVFMAGSALAFGALTHARNDDYRNEISIWSDTVAKRPGSSRAHNNLGQALLQAGRHSEAKAEFQAALRIKPDFAGAHSNLASLFGTLGLHEEAIAEARLAVSFDPNSADAYYNLGVGLSHVNRLNESAETLQSVLKLRPQSAAAHSWLANVYLRLNRPAEAGAHAQLAIAIDPKLVDARFFLATSLFQLGRFAEALPAYEAVLRLQPNHIEAQYALGTTLLQLGRLHDAVSALDGAVRLDPGHARAHVNLGIALWQSGQQSEAAAHFEAAVRLDPNLTVAEEYLRKLRASAP